MIKQFIQEFRKENGRHPAKMDYYEDDQNCLGHCLYMAKIKELRHAPEDFRPGKAEVCAARNFFHNPIDSLRMIIFEQFTNSPEHKNIILFNDNLACAFYIIEQYQVFVTVRGW